MMTLDHEVRAVLVDFDGTIGASLRHWTEGYAEALRELGVDISDENDLIAACFHRPQEEVLAEFSISDPEHFYEQVWERVTILMSQVEPYPDCLQVLEEFRQDGLKIGLVTNSRRPTVEAALREWDAISYFDAWATRESVANGKPFPDSINSVLDELNIPPLHAVMIGDHPIDGEAAKAAGVHFIGFSPPENHRFTTREELETLNYVAIIESYRELRNVIRGDRTRC